MTSVTKTTVYLDSRNYRRLKQLATAEGRTAAELVREAVAEYARRRAEPARPRTVGAVRSGHSDFAERAEELLQEFGRDA